MKKQNVKYLNLVNGFITVNNGIEVKHIQPSEVQYYLDMGYMYGTGVKYVFITNGIERHKVKECDLDMWFSKGYIRAKRKDIIKNKK